MDKEKKQYTKGGKTGEYRRKESGDRYENGGRTESGARGDRNRGDSQGSSPRDEFVRSENIIIGRNAVRELLRSGASVDKILVSGREGSVVALIAEAKKAGIPVVNTDARQLDKIAGGENHQGIAAYAAEKDYCSIEDILAIARERGEKPLVVVCDGVEDPHNLGAIIRTAECAGAHGVIIPKRRACGLTQAVSKASAGALLHMAVAKVQNIAGAIDELKEAGVWCFAAEAGGDFYYETDFNCACALVLGGEDSGVSRLVKEKCDYTVSIPMYGRVNSLNVSAAAAVLICHAARVQKG